MARVRIPDAPLLQSWDEANSALLEIAQAEIALANIEGEMNVKINTIKDEAERAAAPIRERISELNKQLKSFAELNRPDFGKAKSKALTFGEIGFRVSSSIVIKAAMIPKVIDNLRKLGMEDCVKVQETVNKEVLKTYPEENIIQSGATIKRSDTFWYETDKQQLMEEQR